MAGIMVSASMGVMKPVLAKLTTLMGGKYKTTGAGAEPKGGTQGPGPMRALLIEY
jgi:hypothetical protein